MKKYLLFIFFLTLFVYSLNLYRQSSGDTLPTKILPFNILQGKGIFLDDFAAPLPKDAYFFQNYNNHVISAYPLLPALLAIPIYIPFYLYAVANDLTTIANLFLLSFDAEKWTASIYASLSVVLFFILIRQISKNNKLSLVFALIFAFATQTFSISSQLLWQHGFANLFLIASQIFFLRKKFSLSLILAVLSFYSRPTFFFFLLLMFIFSSLYDKRGRILYLGIFLTGCLTLGAYNLYFYHSLIGSHGYQIGGFDFNFLANGLGLIFSPARGMLFYTPFFIFAFLPILLRKKFNSQPAAKTLINLNTFFLLSVIIYSSAWDMWFGGYSFGDRFLTDGAASVAILVYFFYSFIVGELKKKNTLARLVASILGILIIYSVFVQIIGVFYDPRAHWEDYPTDVDVSINRLWDFQDNPLLRNLAVGPNTELINQIYYRLNDIKPELYRQGNDCSLRKISTGKSFGYKTVQVVVKNESDVVWATGGLNPIYLGQIYATDSEMLAESAIPSTTLPPIISPNEEAVVSLIILPPSDQAKNIIIAPKQENLGWWINYCKLVVSLK